MQTQVVEQGRNTQQPPRGYINLTGKELLTKKSSSVIKDFIDRNKQNVSHVRKLYCSENLTRDSIEDFQRERFLRDVMGVKKNMAGEV